MRTSPQSSKALFAGASYSSATVAVDTMALAAGLAGSEHPGTSTWLDSVRSIIGADHYRFSACGGAGARWGSG